MTDNTLPDGRKVELVHVKVPIEIEQAMGRIKSAEIRLFNVSTAHEAMLAAQQYGHIVAKGARILRKAAETENDNLKLQLLNLAEEFDALAAIGTQVWIKVKTHPRDIPEHKKERDEALASVHKQSGNAAVAWREYLLAVADEKKAAEAPAP